MPGMKQVRHGTAARPQAGAASLIVIMVLFFLMSLVAAYTSRNLIFEQRTSVNQYRATQAYEAAEAGLEWAMTMLNSGRIGANCLEAGATTADTSFRQRYLIIDAVTGMVTPRSTALWPSCVSDGAGGWICSCPTTGSPTLSAPAGAGVFPAFRVRFTVTGSPTTNLPITRPGLVRIESNGCTKLDNACLDHTNTTAVALEGRASIAVVAALTSALPTPPGAALTVLGDAAASTVSVYNTDPDLGGTTVQMGGMLNGGAIASSGWTLRSVPGTPGPASVVQSDATLSALVGANNRVFASVFSMWPDTYGAQPAAVRLDCPLAGCRAALADAVAKNPDRVIWVTSPNGLTLESAGTIGSLPNPADTSVAGPAIVVVDGPLNIAAANVRVFGLVYSRGGNWQGSNAVDIQGAAFVEGNLAATANATVVMNNAVLKSLRLRSGSFVRAPGGWDDFRGRAP
ncbi:MAG: fimbrial assembly protein [Leptothrix sp. (in: Bacteria)]|nr:fimbrial assembly protein [Leptothrix sp. (in: b-proteobacteria)]